MNQFESIRLWIKNFKRLEHNFGLSFERLVQRINELYFDFSSKDYQGSHSEIFIYECERWKKIGNNYLKKKSSNKILDIGTGSGFVPLNIANSFKKKDLFICSDISKEILEVAEKNIINENFKCKFKYTKIEPQIPYRLPFESDYFNIITMNSLLHHINDINEFLIEIDRISKLLL